jgi:hypothetical protein
VWARCEGAPLNRTGVRDFMMNLILGLALGFAAGLAVGLVMQRRPRSSAPLAISSGSGSTSTPLLDSLLGGDPPAAPKASEKVDNRAAVLEQNLRVKLQYDEEAVARAIARERDQYPDLPEVELIQAAIERWERDNR